MTDEVGIWRRHMTMTDLDHLHDGDLIIRLILRHPALGHALPVLVGPVLLLAGALFWFALLGGPGAVLFRLANTLDAMWGYRTERLRHFGWAAARIDDALGYVPSRLTALSYALFGQTRRALACWRRRRCASTASPTRACPGSPGCPRCSWTPPRPSKPSGLSWRSARAVTRCATASTRSGGLPTPIR